MSETLVRNAIADAIVKLDATSVLDVGCGQGKYLSTLPAQVTTRWGVDANAREIGHIVGPRLAAAVIATAEDFLPRVQSKSFDVVIALDFIEHLDQDTSRAVVVHMRRICRSAVLVFTPKGFVENGDQYHDPESRYLQTHRCGWLPKDLEDLGFSVTEWSGFDYGQGLGPASAALWAEWVR